MRKILLPAIVLFLFLSASIEGQMEKKYHSGAEDIPMWVQLMYLEDADIGGVMTAYNSYYETHPFVKNAHTQYYKRWLRDLSRTAYPDEKFLDKSFSENELVYIEGSKKLVQERSSNSSWSGIGPYTFDKEAASSSYAPGAAHVYTVEQAPSNSNVFYAGTATGGLWKSLDKGLSWVPLTNDLMLNEVKALEVDFSDENNIYFGGGGKLYQSINGGLNWNIIGGTAFNGLSHSITDIAIKPNNSDVLFVCSNQGLYKSMDGGSTFTNVMYGEFQEIEFHPSNNNIIYVVQQLVDQTYFYRSTDGGDSFELQTNGWPSPSSGNEQKRTEIAVSAAAPNKVFALATGSVNGGSGLYGVYVSDDQGSNWNFVCCGPQEGGVASVDNPNLMGWLDDGSDGGGQYYYDLAFDVSDTDPDFMVVGGINVWYSYDGGANFSCPAKWNQSEKVNYVHADIHDIRFYGDDLWLACDGGIFYSEDDGETMEIRMTGIEGTDFWGFGAGFLDGEVMLGGTYHNATLLKDNTTYNEGWLSMAGGDNHRGFVNFGKTNIVYHDHGKSKLSGNRSVPLVALSMAQKPNASYVMGKASEIAFSPRCYNIFYMGYSSQLLKTEDDGKRVESIYDFGDDVTVIEVAWENPAILYVGTWGSYWGANKKLWRSEDGGTSFVDVTPYTTNSWLGYDVTVSSDDPYEIWAVRVHHNTDNGSADGEKVYHSIDGGNNWTNITTPTLDGEFLTNISHQRGSDGGVYVGTRRAVYYKDHSMTDWALFNTDLPLSTFSTKLVPYYGEGKIRNATNRSVYECDFYNESVPDAQISVDKFESYCVRDTFYFVDHSALKSTGTRQWSFSGGTPATSTERNPKVVYQNPGTYEVSLTVIDDNGSDTQTISNFISVINECEVDTIPGNALSLNGTTGHTSTEQLELNSNTVSMSAWIKRNGTQNDFAGIIFSRGANTIAGLNIKDTGELRYHWNGNGWAFQSGLFVPDNEWTHVALVITPNHATIYMNGIPSIHNIPQNIEEFDAPLLVGLDNNGGPRFFNGQIDEVCIWEKSLAQSDIRELMHLTKVPTNDPDLIAYYQYNRNTGDIADRANSHHAIMMGGSSRIPSTVAVGGGFSDGLSEQNGWPVFESNVQFSANYTVQNGANIISSMIQQAPYGMAGIAADHEPLNNQYWILNRYGTGGFEAELSFQTSEDLDINDQNYPMSFALYQRPFYEDEGWSLIGVANAVNAANNVISFPNITIEGQYFLARMPLEAQKVGIRVCLEGPYNELTNSMSTDLKDNGLLPINQPYYSVPWNYDGGEVFNASSYAIVDWLLIEARDIDDDELVIERTAALLDNTGYVRSTDGTLGASFYTLDENQDYYFVVRHRNHLDIMTENPLSINNTSVYNLAVTNNVRDGINQLTPLASGDYAMKAGDFDGNGVASLPDFNQYLLSPSQLEGYYQLDCTLDKHTTVDDYNLYRKNASMIGIDQIRY